MIFGCFHFNLLQPYCGISKLTKINDYISLKLEKYLERILEGIEYLDFVIPFSVIIFRQEKLFSFLIRHFALLFNELFFVLFCRLSYSHM